MFAIAWCTSRSTVFSSAAITAVQELDAIGNDFDFRTLLTVFIIPVVELESSFDETGTALG
jgi:hypothetical protein